MFTRRRDAHVQGTGQVDLARGHIAADTREHRQGFTSQQRPVKFALTTHDHAIDGHTATGFDANDVAHDQFGNRHSLLARCRHTQGARHLQRGKLFCGGARNGASAEIQIPTGQQKERQGYRRVEIGVLTRLQRLQNRGHKGQQDRQRNRHIHVQPPRPQRGIGVFEKRLTRERDGRQGDQCGNPVEQIPRRVRRA